MKTLKLLIFGTLLLFVGSLSAQVTGVNYQLKYDTVDCRYDAFLIINAGSASSISERVQFNSQFSVIVPTGTTVTVDESHMPLLNNSTYAGTVPIDWQLGTSVINDAALPGYDFHSITPYIDLQTYHYNNISAGDTIKLFSLSTSPIENCGDEIRMYENGADPTSADLAGGTDFSNGYTQGSPNQLYEANSTILHPPAPTLVSLTNQCGNGIEIDLTAYTSDCQGPLTYEWEGPDSYSSTLEDVIIQPALPVNNGLYSVTITDAFGCTTVATIDATSKPNAGPDEVMCAGECITISGTDPITGTWAQQAGNAPGATLNPLPSGQVQVCMANSASSAFGDFNFIYSIPGCSDTMNITVNPKPLTIIQGPSNICVFDSVLFAANIAGGTWSAINPTVATINPTTGYATGVSSGTATFTYTTADGCASISPTLTINPQPIVTDLGSGTICVGSTTQLTPQAGGSWSELNPGIATVTSSGLVEGVSEGTAGFQFLDGVSGCLSDTIFVDVTAVPVVVFIGNDSLCVGGFTQVEPSVNVSWTSSNTSVLTIDNFGNITGQGVGTATVTVTDLASGCVSDESPTIWVLDAPTVSITGPTNLCIGELSQASPSTGGTWTSNDTLVATITNSGVITAVGSGPVDFTFVETATGCESTTETLIVDTPPTVSVDFATICIGGTANLTPSTGGTWTALESDTASVSGAVVTGILSGTAGFIFTSDASGCDSDTIFVTVEPGTTVGINGDSEICIGETTSLDSDGEIGSWICSDATIATVTNAGVVTGVGAGQVTCVFTSNATLCMSDPTDPITVYPAPVLSIDDSNLCIGETTFANSTAFGGTWSVTDASTNVATINQFTGQITAIGAGSVTFTYTDGFTGCSTESGILVVNQTPEISFTGPDEICEDETTNVEPTTGGTWMSGNINIATVDNNGTVTGQGAGTTTLTFTETVTGCASVTLSVTIIGATPVTDPVDSELCIGDMTTVTPTTGGTWVSSAPEVATIDAGGNIIAVSSGSAFFTFTSTTGSAQCSSNSTAPVLVNPMPTIVLDATEVCVGEFTNATSTTAGVWTSTNDAVASINATTGLIEGLTPGTTTFTFVSDVTGCVSDPTVIFTVGEPAPVTSGAAQICVGEETNVFPSTGGTWTSSNDAIATIDNFGLVSGVSPGSVVFYYTEAGGCQSAPTDSTEVTPGPDTNIGSDDQLCIGETIQILPSAGGSWVSSNDDIATITDGGLVTAVSAGLATFTFTSNTTGCSSQPTDPVTVNGPVSTIITGNNVICIGATTQMSPTTGGLWSANDPGIATIDPMTGEVTGVSEGDATFIFTPTDTGCPSDDSDPVSVSPTPAAELFEFDLCIGATTTLSPTTGGTWASSDATIASVLDNGEVTAHASGIVTFTFTETASGCASADATDPLTITDCLNPDFNATFVDIPVDGDVSTNDGTPAGTTYGTPVLTSSPLGAIFDLTVNPDGTYTFVTDVIGVYTWDVAACIPPLVAGCQTAELVITVVDFLDPDNKPVANVDIATTEINTAVTLISLSNDKCVVVGGCDLDPNITIVAQPENGTVSVDASTGNTTYTPNLDFVGLDTLRYEVCVVAEPTNCAQAYQIITVLSGSALNTTIAADDFNSGGQDTPITGNVSDNDTDPEGDTQTVSVQTTTIAGIGTLTVATDGSYTFVPEETFYGPVDFPYVTCDDNVDQACANATLHLLVVRDLYIQVRVYLEGAFINNDNEIGSHLRPLMRDDLRSSSFTAARYIPDTEPYSTLRATAFDSNSPQHWETIGDYATDNHPFYRYGYDVSGQAQKFLTVPNPTEIFSKEGEDAVVDWVSVELRSKSDNTLMIAQRSGLVQRDGDVIDLNGEDGLRFSGLVVDDYYVVVRHRNHLGAMTAAAQTPTQLADLIDFTVPTTGFFDFGATKNIFDYTGLSQAQLSGSAASNKTGYLALWGGDFDANGQIKFTNPDDDLNNLLGNVFGYEIVVGLEYNFFTNFDFAFGYQTGDYDLNSKSKFDNPNDDKNYLFGQLLFYPLNSDFRSNFDFFIEQIPEAIVPR